MKMEGFQLSRARDLGLGHSSTSIYIPNFIEMKETLWMNN